MNLEVNVKETEVCKIAQNAFGKYVDFIRGHLYALV
jgi:hypothetical protein